MKKPRITILAVFFILFSGVFLPGGQKAVIFPETGVPWCVVDGVIKGGQAEKLGIKPMSIEGRLEGERLGIYANLPREKFDAEKEILCASLKKDLPVIEFWKLASSFVARKGKLLRPDYELTYVKLASYSFDPNAEVLLALEVISRPGKN